MGKSASQAKMPTAAELGPILELESKYNRVGTNNQLGGQNYSRNPDGSFNMDTTLTTQGQALADRAGKLGMTDSAKMQMSPQMESIAGALASRVGQRNGMAMGSQPMQLMGNQPQPQQKPQPQAQPQAQLPQAQPTPGYPPQAGGYGTGGYNPNSNTNMMSY